MNCPYPHCTLPEFHDGKHDTQRYARIWESGKLCFAIVGAFGFAGCLAAMHLPLALLSLALVAGTWWGVYKITVIE